MIYVVQPGDTLYGISRRYGTDPEELARVNQIPDPDVLIPGQSILLYNGIPNGPLTIDANAYAYTFISPFVLNETLRQLSTLSVFSYGFFPDGTLIPPLLDDRRLVEAARRQGVRSALVLTPMDREGRFSNVLIALLLNDAAARQRLLDNLAVQMAQVGYEELNIDFEYILPGDRDAFTDFVRQAADTLPYTVSVCLAPKTSRNQRGLLYEGKDYAAIGQAADRVLLMTYEWGYKYGPPLAVAPIYAVRQVVEYALTEIPREKIALGLPNYGYDWPLPYVSGQTVARTIGSIEAVDIARRNRTNIIFDNPSQSPWFQYTDDEGIRHVVWFEDLRSWQAKFDLVKEYGLSGVGIWTAMNLFRAGLLLLGENFRQQPAGG